MQDVRLGRIIFHRLHATRNIFIVIYPVEIFSLVKIIDFRTRIMWKITILPDFLRSVDWFARNNVANAFN